MWGPGVSIYVMVDTLKYLKKGGRITPAAAALGTLLKIKPVLQIQGEKLDTFSKARTVKQAKNIMLAAAVHDLEELRCGWQCCWLARTFLPLPGLCFYFLCGSSPRYLLFP